MVPEPVAVQEPVQAELLSEKPAQVEWTPEQPLQDEPAKASETHQADVAQPPPEAAPAQPEASAPATIEAPMSTGPQATTEAVTDAEAATSTEAAAAPEAPVAPQASTVTDAPTAEAAAKTETPATAHTPPATTEASAAAEAPATAEVRATAEVPAPAEASSATEVSAAAETPATTEAPAAAEATAADAGAIETAAASAAPQQPKPPDERRIRAQQAWERVVAARESGETLNGTVTAAVKGGLLVDVGGIRGFLPASQTRVEAGTPIEAMVKAKLPLKVIDVDTGRRRIVVSHRRALQDERRSKRTELLRSLAIGQVREGVVVRIAEFGAFVDLGGIDGLIPMRELAFERIDKASDVVKIGEKLPVEVIRIEEGGKKIALSRKNALPDPWRDHAAVLKQGGTVEGKVVAKDPRLQVEIAPGVVGSVRENDANPADYEIGEAIEVVVRRVDRATRRITLSTTNAVPDVPQQQQTSTGFAPLGIELGRRK
jgi:predicted RNA-binding protein with RPS1 domain